jgi:hypothetical protein
MLPRHSPARHSDGSPGIPPHARRASAGVSPAPQRPSVSYALTDTFRGRQRGVPWPDTPPPLMHVAQVDRVHCRRDGGAPRQGLRRGRGRLSDGPPVPMSCDPEDWIPAGQAPSDPLRPRTGRSLHVQAWRRGRRSGRRARRPASGLGRKPACWDFVVFRSQSACASAHCDLAGGSWFAAA